MGEFKDVTVLKEANVYFEGKVTSRTIIFADGSKKTLGIMLPGEYQFNTAEKELMEITVGELDILLPKETSWKKVIGPDSFMVPANSSFSLKVNSIADYVCSYIKE